MVVWGSAITEVEALVQPQRGGAIWAAVVLPVCKVAVAAAVTYFGQPIRRESDTLAAVIRELQLVNLHAATLEAPVLEDDSTAATAIRYYCAGIQIASAKAVVMAGRGTCLKCSKRGSLDNDDRSNAQLKATAMPMRRLFACPSFPGLVGP